MLGQKRDQTFQKSFKKYLKKSGRVSFQLKDLIQLLKVPENFQQFRGILLTSQKVPHLFKILILINRIMLERIAGEHLVSQIISNLKWQAKRELEIILQKKLLIPYKLYLQKRAVSKINSYYAKTASQSEVRVYQLINLLTMGTSFADIIYTFGRYYLNQYGWAVDFNISIGADLQIIYKNMVDNIRRPASRQILQEIQILHQKLYVVFYNCYFHKYLKHYVPKWVITDIPTTPKKDTSKSTRSNSNTKVRSYSSVIKSKSAIVNTKKYTNYINNDSLLGQSCLFLNGKVQEVVENVELQDDIYQQKEKNINERFNLLKSMQRVVSMFKQ